MQMRRVTGLVLGENFAAYTVSVPRPAADGPGRAYAHLYAVPDVDDAIQRRGERRTLIGGKHSASGAAIRPGTRTVTVTHRGPDRPHREVWGTTPEGGPLFSVAQTPNGVLSYKWRPDGTALAYTALDPMPENRARARALGMRHKIVDEEFQHVSLWLWEEGEEGPTTRKLTQGKSVFGYEWSPDGRKLAVALAPRNLVDDSYMFKRLFVLYPEANTLSRLVSNPGKLGSFAWSPDGSELAYVSGADRNDPHAGTLYVVGARGGPPRALTEGFAGMVHQALWTKPDELLVHISRGVRSELVTMDPATGRMRASVMTPNLAVTRLTYGPDGRVGIVASAPNHPDEAFVGAWKLYEREKQPMRRLSESNPWLRGIPLGNQQVVTVPARDGTPIEGLLIYPVGYVQDRKYPMVIVAHGGPESHFLHGWLTGYGRWGQMLAARGYFVWNPNYRASTGYGVEFAKADHGDPMGREFEDHLDAIAHFRRPGHRRPRSRRH